MSLRYLNQQVIKIDSGDRISGTHNDFIAEVNLDPTKEVDRVLLNFTAIKKSFKLVETDHNTFTLREGSNSATIRIPTGAYSSTTFSTALTTLLNAGSPSPWTYSISFNDRDGTFTYTCVGGNPSFIFPADTEVYFQMGFEPESTNTFVGGTLTSTNMLNFQKDTIDIHTDMVTNGLTDRLATIPATGPDFSTIVYYCADGELNSKPFRGKASNRYRFRVLDQNDHNLELTLPVYFEIIVYKQNDKVDRLCEKIDGLLEIIKYKLLK